MENADKIEASGSVSSYQQWPGWLPLLFLLNMGVKFFPVMQGIMLHPDAPVYLWSAQSLAADDIRGAIAVYPMLFYPFLISLVKQSLAIDWLTAGRSISLIASSLALIPFWGLARKFCSGTAAIFATLFFIFLPQYNEIAFAVLRDPLYICLALWAVYLASELGDTLNIKKIIPLALIVLVLPQLRVEGIVVSLTIIIWGLAVIFPHLNIKVKILSTTILFLLFCSVAIVIQQSPTAGEVIRLPQIKTFLKDAFSFPPGVSYYLNIIDELAHTKVAHGIGNNFWQAICRNWLAVFAIGMLAMFAEVLGLPLIIAGGIGGWRIVQRDKNGWLLIAVFLTSQLLIFYKYLHTGSMEERIMLFPSLVWLLFAGAALGPLAERLGKIEMLSWSRTAVVIALGLFLLVPLLRGTIDNKYRIHVPVLRESCFWLRDNVLPENRDWRIVGNVRRIAWFLDRRDALIGPTQKAEEIFEFLGRGTKAKMVVCILNKKNKEDITLKEKLLNSTSLVVKFFPGGPGERFFVVAAWNKATLQDG